MSAFFIHPTAEVSAEATIGAGTKVWSLCQIRDNAKIGTHCNIGRNVFIDVDVKVGSNCKIQNNALLYEGVSLEDGVFVGPAVCFTNDKLPRAITPEGELKSPADWTVGHTLVKYGASIGAQSVIVTGVTIGRFALVGSGSVVTRDVPDFALMVGNPARQIGYVCKCANRLTPDESSTTEFTCPKCARKYLLNGNNLSEADK